MLNHPKRLLALSICMMLFGIAVPFLMVMRILESTFFLNFLSFAASTLGFLLGMVGAAMSSRRR